MDPIVWEMSFFMAAVVEGWTFSGGPVFFSMSNSVVPLLLQITCDYEHHHPSNEN